MPDQTSPDGAAATTATSGTDTMTRASAAPTTGMARGSGSDTASAADALTRAPAPDLMTQSSAAKPAGTAGAAAATAATAARGSGSDTVSAADSLMAARAPGAPTVNEPAGAAAERAGTHDTLAAQGRAVILAEGTRSRAGTAKVAGAVLAGAALAGAIPFLLARRKSTAEAKPRPFERGEEAEVEEMVLVERPARLLYDFWRNFTNLPEFMENVRSVTQLDDRRSHWVIAAPAGTSVEFDSMIVEDVPGERIAWHSLEGADVRNRGRVEFIDTAGGRGTLVRAVLAYEPPAGTAGRLVAKLFQREPAVQARRDLRRFKQLMETGAIEGA